MQCVNTTRMRQQRWRARLGAKGRVEGLAAADVQSVGYQTRATAVRFALTRWAARMRACGEPMHQWLQGWNSAVAATDMPAQTSPERCRVGGQMRRRGAMCVMRDRGHHSLAQLWSASFRGSLNGQFRLQGPGRHDVTLMVKACRWMCLCSPAASSSRRQSFRRGASEANAACLNIKVPRRALVQEHPARSWRTPCVPPETPRNTRQDLLEQSGGNNW